MALLYLYLYLSQQLTYCNGCRDGYHCTRVLRAFTHAIYTGAFATAGTDQYAVSLVLRSTSWSERRSITDGLSGEHFTTGNAADDDY